MNRMLLLLLTGGLAQAQGYPPQALVPETVRSKATVPVSIREPRTGMELVRIAKGCFQMGSPESERGRSNDESPQHQVCLAHDYYLGKYEVTQAQWQAVMGRNPSKFKGANLPVEEVSWNEAQEFISKLNTQGQGGYRFPTEAEWEYAARAGTTTAYSWGNEIGWGKANCDGCGSPWDAQKTAPVGSFQANALGLYDMHGNVWEWTCSAYDTAYNGEELKCADHAESRVLRGGSWFGESGWLRSAYRLYSAPDNRCHTLGFRVARTSE